MMICFLDTWIRPSSCNNFRVSLTVCWQDPVHAANCSCVRLTGTVIGESAESRSIRVG